MALTDLPKIALSLFAIIFFASSSAADSSIELTTELTTEPTTQSATSSLVRLATHPIEPYQLLDENGQLSGLAPKIIDCTMKSMNLAYTIDVLPWARAQKNVELGEHDGFFVASRNASRDAYATSSAPLFKGTRSWILRPGLEGDPTSEEFKRKMKVGAVFGTNMHAWLKENFEFVVTRADEISLIHLLQDGRLDVLLITDAMFEYVLNKHHIDSTGFTTHKAGEHPLGVYFGNSFLAQHTDFIEQFNNALTYCSPEHSS